jgi:hypothetical protein
MKKGFLMRLRNKNNGVCESKERKKNNLGKIFNCDEHQQIISGGLFWSRATFTYRGGDFEGLTRALPLCQILPENLFQ